MKLLGCLVLAGVLLGAPVPLTAADNPDVDCPATASCDQPCCDTCTDCCGGCEM